MQERKLAAFSKLTVRGHDTIEAATDQFRLRRHPLRLEELLIAPKLKHIRKIDRLEMEPAVSAELLNLLLSLRQS